MLENSSLPPPWGKEDQGSTIDPIDCPVLPRGHLGSHKNMKKFLE